MRKILFAACLLPIVLLDTGADSIGKGIFPNTTVVVGTTNVKVGSLTRIASASCGGDVSAAICHRTTPFLTTVDVKMKDLILPKNGSTTVDVAAANPGVPGVRGGFCADVTLGTLVAGATSKVDATAKQITHTSFAARNWSFGYKAGATTGLAEFYCVANCVNGNGRADGADEWGFHTGQLLAKSSTPVRMYVNADGVTSTGAGCDDGWGNQSVFGAPEVPSVGNVKFRLEAFGLPPASNFLFMLSVGGTAPAIDLKVAGAPGCFIRTNMTVQVLGPTSGGDAVKGEGKVVLPAPIPNDPRLKGLDLFMQIGAIDKKPKRPFPLVVTNGLKVTIQ